MQDKVKYPLILILLPLSPGQKCINKKTLSSHFDSHWFLLWFLTKGHTRQSGNAVHLIQQFIEVLRPLNPAPSTLTGRKMHESKARGVYTLNQALNHTNSHFDFFLTKGNKRTSVRHAFSFAMRFCSWTDLIRHYDVYTTWLILTNEVIEYHWRIAFCPFWTI